LPSVCVSLPRSIVERLKKEAGKLGVSLEEYIVDRLLKRDEPAARAAGYMEASREALRRAREALASGDLNGASARLWSAAVLAVKAYAASRGESPSLSDGGLWRYPRLLARELGDWVGDSWAHAVAMSVCSHEHTCSSWHVERALEGVERLVEGVARVIGVESGNNRE